MPDIWIPNKEIFCPLCDEPFKVRKLKWANGMTIKTYICQPCKIFTFPIDPAFNKWRDTDKVIECPKCQTSMKWFSRFMDNYMKTECPSCGLGFEKDSDMTVNEDGTVEVEDFKEDLPEDITMEIPVDKLKIPEDKKRQLKHKIRKNREEGK